MDSDRMYDVVIVGCGHSGAQLAVALRQNGFQGSVAMVDGQDGLPYERPPLSKDYLMGTKRAEDILIRADTYWADHDIDLYLGAAVEVVDPVGHRIRCAGGELRYGTLVWAAGGAARRWRGPGTDLRGVHRVRDRGDVDRIAAELERTWRVCVIGGGYIGLEAAAVLRQLGKEVTLLEAADRVLARVAGAEVAGFVEAQHRSRGVDVRTDVSVAGISGHDGAVSGVRLADGTAIPCEMVVVGIGIDPVAGVLQDAGARVEQGLVVDAVCRTSLPDVHAIGDCAVRPNRFARDLPTRLESVHNANDHAAIVARHLTGRPYAQETVPWFWSTQYDLRLQTVGVLTGYDRTVTRGDLASGSFSVAYLRQGCLIALDCVNATRDFVQGRALVTGGMAPDLDLLADPDVPLKSLAAATAAQTR
ncbi:MULTISPECIES: NAD(P)/FAD-dependent oxidoreductase [Streptomyces]|uniref:NAD(P)/FAD-dependent oxidoreductase n=1 Tax=Streptomyces TaxID=1883 RepID=UPI0033BB5EAC